MLVSLACEGIQSSVGAGMKQDKFAWKGPELKPSQVFNFFIYL
jgi:ubiquitin carboxyl-terminal hydrolase 5/13